MNRVFLIGNLTKDPEVRTTTTGKKVATCSIAVNDGKNSDGGDLVQYFTIKAWDRQAEIIESYVKKGHKLAIVGRLSNRSWDAADGTKRYATDVVLTDMEMLTSKVDAERINQMQQSNPDSNSSNNSNSNSQNSNSNSAKESKSSNNKQEDDNGSLPEIDINDIDLKVQMPF